MNEFVSRVNESLFTLGLFFALIIVGEIFYILLVSNPLGAVWAVGLITSLPFVFALFYISYRLPDSLVSSRSTRINYWVLAALSVFLLMNISIMMVLPPASTLELVSWIRWATTIGACTGLIIGVFEARSIDRAVEAERIRIRAEEAENRTDLLRYLNSLLRHEVLNASGVIQGQAELAAIEAPDNTIPSKRLDAIRTRAQELEAVIDDVRVLLDAFKGESNTSHVNLNELLISEIRMIENTDRTVVIETSIPDEVAVRANETLRRAFRNLLQNAIEHNTSDVPRIEVTVEQRPETVTIQIADNGPGVPSAKREYLFEEELRDGHKPGLGLLLTATLIESFDGTIELTETGSDGTVFTIELHRASDEPTSEQSNDGTAVLSQAV